MIGIVAGRCPECGRAFDPNDESSVLSTADNAARPRLSRTVRAAIVLGGLGLWYLATMRNATANTSWEHHPYAGPFVIIKGSLAERHTASDWAIALFAWMFVLTFPVHWIITGRWWSLIVALLLCGACVWLSYFAAVTASC